MNHITTVSEKRMPPPAISLLEKQAMTDMIQRNVAQVLVVLNVLTGFKEYR